MLSNETNPRRSVDCHELVPSSTYMSCLFDQLERVAHVMPSHTRAKASGYRATAYVATRNMLLQRGSTPPRVYLLPTLVDGHLKLLSKLLLFDEY